MTAIPGRLVFEGLQSMPHRLRQDPLAGLLFAAATATSLAAAAGGLTLLVRRLAGGFAAPPPLAIGWVVAAVGIALVAAVDASNRLGGRNWASGITRIGLLAAASAVMPVTGLTGWPEQLAGLAAFLVAVVAVLAPRPRAGHAQPRERPGSQLTTGMPRPRCKPTGPWPEPVVPERESRAGELSSVPPPAGFRQRLERNETPTGEDCIRGRVILAVATGSRTGHAHVGFCPSFAAIPAIDLTTDYDGVEAELTVAEVLPWGLRLECRLAEPAEEPLEIPVDFQAQHAP